MGFIFHNTKPLNIYTKQRSLPAYKKLFVKFEDYHFSNAITKNLSKMGFRRPTDIQYKSIPSILKGEDVLAIAQTGTGKTAAFAIPILDKLYRSKKNATVTVEDEEEVDSQPQVFGSKNVKPIKRKIARALIMEPTRELAIQVSDVLKTLGRGTKLKTIAIVGGMDQDPQISELENGVDVLVATPGRVFDLHHQGFLDLSKVEILVLDEADHMLDLGFIKDIQDLIERLPKKRQTLFFSATINERIKKLAYSLVRNPIRIQLSPKDPVAKNIDHALAYVEMDDKRFFLQRLIQENPAFKMLVFVRTQVRAERVAAAMARVNINADTLHGGKEQNKRLETLAAFKGKKLQLLIATDVSARGIDIQDVDMVVNYDMPDVPENYVHRVGRTGRGNNRGKAISFCADGEKELLEAIENYTGKSIERLSVDKSTKEATVQIASETELDLKKLMAEVEAFENRKKKRKKK